MSIDISSKVIPSSLEEVLSLGKFYFESVDFIYPYLGDTQLAYDATEVLLLLIGMKGKYTQQHNIIDLLHMDYQKVKKSVTFLKNKGCIFSSKKGLLVNNKMKFEFSSIDEAFEVYGSLHTLDDWYGEMDDHWKVMSLIDCFYDWLGLGISDCSKRQFVKCLCYGKVEGFTYTKTKQFEYSIQSLDFEDLNDRYTSNTYREDMEKKYKSDQKRKWCLGNYQKAKLLLLQPQLLNKKTPFFIPKEAKEAFELSTKYFPYNDKELGSETLNKRHIFIYEYLVHQQCSEDTDFSPFSPFYGLPLKERLSMLKDTIGRDSSVFNRGYLTQTQWSGAFNYSKKKVSNWNSSSYLSAYRTKVWWDKPKKKKVG